MPRPYCEHCEFPSQTCICDLVNSVPAVKYSGKIHVLQHPGEKGHAKNTVRLAKLLMPDLTIWLGEQPEDFSELTVSIRNNVSKWACFYPSTVSCPQSSSIPMLPDTNLLFIDATWRKARKIWHLNSWLHSIPQFHFAERHKGQYRIRKNHAEYQLSTIEAIAYAIQDQANTSPLFTLFDQFQNQQAKFHSNGNNINQSK